MRSSRPATRLSPGDALAAALAGIATWRLVLTVLEAPRHTFAETRLMPLLVALAGKSPYAPPSDGACYLPMYPPLSFLCYAPAALFQDPGALLRAAAALTLLMALVPFALFLRLSAGGEERLRRGVFAFAALVFLVHVSPVLVTAVFVHADTPAVSLAATGALLVVLASRRDSGRLMALAALVLSLVPWTKQTLLPAPLLPILVLACRGRWRLAGAHLAFAAALQAAWAGLFSLAFGGPGLRFWILEFPGRHPWLGEPFEILALSNRVLLSIVVLELAVLAGAAFALRERLALRSDWSRHPWALLAVTALLLWPSSLIGYVKVGGALNSFLPTAYFLTCAVLLLLVDREAAAAFSLPSEAAMGALLAASTLLGAQVAVDCVTGTLAVSRATWESTVAFDTLRKSPDEFLFPWFPLSTRLATGRFAHSDLGLGERALAGLAVAPDQLRAGLPRGLRFVVCGKDPCESTLARFSVLGQRRISTPSGGWTLYEVAPPR